MLRVAVVDDEQTVRAQLCDFLARYAGEKQLAIQVDPYHDGTEIAAASAGEYDIILLDIDMPHMEGMQAAQAIRQRDRDTVLVFITNMAQCAIRGYEVEALDFIVKPVAYEAFCMRIARAIKRVHKREEKTIALQTEKGLQIVPVQDILWMETAGHNLICHTKTAAWTIKSSLRHAMEMVQGASFACCNKCYLVNLAHVEEIRGDTVVVGGTELEVSRRQKAAFSQAVLEYMGEVR